MTGFRYGPVEMYLVGFEGDRPAPSVIQALVEQLESGLVRLLDFVIVARSDDGEVTVTEVLDESDEYGFGTVELHAVGIAGDEDIADFAELVPPGDSAALVVLELLYQRKLAESLAASGGVVLATERIPAPIVNAIADLPEGD